MDFRRMVLGVVLVGAVFWGTGCGPTVEAEEVAAQELQGEKKRQFCGGIAGFPCPEGLTCVDDPRDSCDPNQGGADCGGICQKVKCPKESNDLYYVSRDPGQCAATTFICNEDEGFTQFFTECGCGCERKRNTCNAPHRRYVSRDPAQCAAIRFICEPGEQHFFDECGCGCEPVP